MNVKSRSGRISDNAVLIRMINRSRKKRNSDTLLWRRSLFQSCLKHSREMAKNGRLYHSGSVTCNECVAVVKGDERPKSIFDAWRNSPPHWRSLMSDHVTHHAVAIVKGKNGTYATWQGVDDPAMYRLETSNDVDW